MSTPERPDAATHADAATGDVAADPRRAMADAAAAPGQTAVDGDRVFAGTAGSGPQHPSDTALATGWQPLPARARLLFVLGNLFGFGFVAVALLVPIGLLVESPALALGLGLASLVLLPAWGTWLAYKQHRHTQWLLDGDGFALRRGRFWHRETRVPATRVQHLDLKRGPLERRFDLATLVIHTAGTRHSEVTVAGLDAACAGRLRDHLARQAEADDDDA